MLAGWVGGMHAYGWQCRLLEQGSARVKVGPLDQVHAVLPSMLPRCCRHVAGLLRL
jgi:hypothetical protein